MCIMPRRMSWDEILTSCDEQVKEMEAVSKEMIMRYGMDAAAVREEVLCQLLDRCLNSLASVPEPKESDLRRRAHIAHIRGHALHAASNRYREAIEALELAVKLGGQPLKTWLALADCHYQVRNIEMSRSCLEHAESLFGETKEILRGKAQTCVPHMGDDTKKVQQERLDLAQKALSMDETDTESWFVVGTSCLLLYLAKFKFSLLEDACKAYSKIGPSDAKYYTYEFHGNAGQLYNVMGNLQGMYEECLALSMSPTDSTVESSVKSVGNALRRFQKQVSRAKDEEVRAERSTLAGKEVSSGQTDAATVSSLETGENRSVRLYLRAAADTAFSSELLGVFGVFLDKEGAAVVVGIRNVASSFRIERGMALEVKMPVFYHCAVKCDGEEVSFPCVTTLSWLVLVNGLHLHRSNYIMVLTDALQERPNPLEIPGAKPDDNDFDELLGMIEGVDDSDNENDEDAAVAKEESSGLRPSPSMTECMDASAEDSRRLESSDREVDWDASSSVPSAVGDGIPSAIGVSSEGTGGGLDVN